MGFGTSIMKTLMFVFNGIVWVLGLVLFIVGIVVLVEGQNWNDIIDNKTVPVSALLIVVGLVIAVVGFLGCFGALKQNSSMLLIYAIILGVIIIVQLVAGILAFIFSDEASTYVQEGLEKGLEDYDESATLTEAIDYVQEEFECCGITTYLDWDNATIAVFWIESGKSGDVPDSCCETYSVGCGVGGINNKDEMHSKDCYTTAVDIVYARGMVFGLVGVCTILCEFFVIFLAHRIRLDVADQKIKSKKGKARAPKPEES